MLTLPYLLLILQEELRPFFSLPKVIDGLFNLAKMLFDISIDPADGQAPVIFTHFKFLAVTTTNIKHLMPELVMVHFSQIWNNDVRFYCVKNSFGIPVAHFYFDPYSRPSEKRGGAWVAEVVGRSRALSRDGASSRLPITHIVCNQTPPMGDKPSLMTFREVYLKS